ncbi:MAG TPA: SDR family NAD(P)-dependent oxidoreductase [Solirubrobacterales bacterium]|nr:SDR family NAD(P)-dependent oxidoreductase [Solirubrobacterales bacterium]
MRIEPGTRALVTGASRGIGRATAAALAARGARLGMIARSREPLEQTAGELGGEPIVLPADIGDRAAVADAVDEFARQAGGIELLVANAGIAHYGPFHALPIERAEEMVRINLLGTLYTVKAALRHMLDRASGHVVVVASGASLRAFPWAATYGATKSAQSAFAEALRHELSGTGVSVSTIFPGEIATDLHAHERDRMPDWYRGADAIPPEKVAAAIVRAVEEDRRVAYVPPIVRALGLNGLAPRLADRLLAALRGATAAPRRD